jgi:hypothetical protein
MSGYKVFQCSAMDYHLEPARYEKIVMTKMMARYELRMNCDWISALQTALDDVTLGDEGIVSEQISIERMRKALCTGEGFYNAGGFTTGSNGSLDPINEQWAELIDVILRNTAWSAVADTTAVAAADGTTGEAGSSRRVSQAKVDTEMGYTANVAAGSLVDGNFVATDKDVAATTDDQGRDVLGIKAMVSPQTPYDKEKLGDLLNNTNVGEVLGKMRNHGCFIKDEDKAGGPGYVVNPFVQEALSGDASHNQGLQTLLDLDDELVFPINLKSIVGHTADNLDEDISKAFELEINIVFKQNNSATPSDGENNDDHTTQYGSVTGVSTASADPATSDKVEPVPAP